MTKEQVTIVEVGPRDGLQDEAIFIPTALKLQFIHDLADSGLINIEATSCVSAHKIPQMADHAAIMAALDFTGKQRYSVLVPNLTGLHQALTAGIQEIAVFTATSDTFCQHNTNCSLSTSMQRIAEIITHLSDRSMRIRAYLSCVFACPYEGPIATSTVSALIQRLFSMGVDEVSLGDTIGVGTPEQTAILLDSIDPLIPRSQLAVHFHDTHRHALANIKVALDHGIRIIDSAAGGLGGCPYAPGASGNVATEAVIELLDSQGYTHGINKDRVTQAAQRIQQYLKQI